MQCLLLVHSFDGHAKALDYVALTVASAAAVSALVLNVVPFGAWEKESRDFLRQWTDLREDVESLLFRCPGEPVEHHICELEKLDGKLHRLCGAEPSPNKDLLEECHRAEKQSRPSEEPSIEKPELAAV